MAGSVVLEVVLELVVVVVVVVVLRVGGEVRCFLLFVGEMEEELRLLKVVEEEEEEEEGGEEEEEEEEGKEVDATNVKEGASFGEFCKVNTSFSPNV